MRKGFSCLPLALSYPAHERLFGLLALLTPDDEQRHDTVDGKVSNELAPAEKWQREIEGDPQNQRHEANEGARNEEQSEGELHRSRDEDEIGVAHTLEADRGKEVEWVALEKLHTHWDVPQLLGKRQRDDANPGEHSKDGDGTRYEAVYRPVKSLKGHVERARPASHHEHEERDAEK